MFHLLQALKSRVLKYYPLRPIGGPKAAGATGTSAAFAFLRQRILERELDDFMGDGSARVRRKALRSRLQYIIHRPFHPLELASGPDYFAFALVGESNTEVASLHERLRD